MREDAGPNERSAPGLDEARAVARETFGYETLHRGQDEALGAVLAGRDTLAVMPTGFGKSAIYQIAGVLIPGPTVVVSPLIALQRDQVESLAERGLAAAELNSTITASRRSETLAALTEGALEFVFVAPEQLANEESRATVRSAKPSLVVVDEAHCVSEWGHDFRPEYLRLGELVEELGRPRVLALTATAAPPVRREIVERLDLRDPEIVVRGFDRPNIWLGVERFHEEDAKDEALAERVAEAEKPGIVYVATRRGTEEAAEALCGRGLRAAAYHAGLKASERDVVQQAFMDDEIDVIVSTIAFGMGVDKPNVRFVFHRDIPESVDAYYQELGRAGRDGEPARALLFYRPEDVGLRRFFAGTATLDVDELEDLVEAVAASEEPVGREDLEADEGLGGSTLSAGLRRLEDAGAVEILPDGDVAPGREIDDARAAARDAVEAHERHAEWERSRVEMMRGYAEVRDCRREYVLNYFGEEFEAPCGTCDNCEAGVVEPDAEQPFPLGTRVAHGAWGEGLVQRYERDKIVVLFDEAGYKTLDVDLVRERRLLEEAP
jgi:ATP-dependent DNA helicase RecQ